MGPTVVMYSTARLVKVILIVLFFGILLLVERFLRSALSGVAAADLLMWDHLPQDALLGIAFLYSALCAVFLPTPSEAPLLLLNVLAPIPVIFISSAGKMIGSLVLALISRRATGAVFTLLLRRKYIVPESGFIASINGKWGLTAYGLCQAIPFLPMRTSTIVLASTSRPGRAIFLNIAVISFLGSIIRMLIVWWLVRAGLDILEGPVEAAL